MKISRPLGYLKTPYQLNHGMRRSVVLSDDKTRMHSDLVDTTLLVDRLLVFTTNGHMFRPLYLDSGFV